MGKMIINKVPEEMTDEDCVRMVLAVIRKGRANEKATYKPHSEFDGGYHVTTRKASYGKSNTDVFWVTKDKKYE